MNILVIGARAAGLKAACRAKRLLPDAKVTVLEEGEYISYASCGLPYFLAADVEEFRQLITTPYNVERNAEYFADSKDIEVLTGIHAEQIDPDKRIVKCRKLSSGENVAFSYDELVLATGAYAIVPEIRGIDLPGVCTFTRPKDAIELRQAAAQNELSKVAIIGGGYIGCELCEAFSALWGIETTLFESESQILSQLLDPDVARIAELELRRQGVRVYLQTRVSEIIRSGQKLEILTESDSRFSDFDRIVIAAGVQPRSELAEKAGINIGPTGGIVVDHQMRTTVAHIFAAGDCVESTHILTGKPCYLPLGSIANRMGRVTGNTIAGREDSFGAVCGSSCLKIFDMNIASVGLTGNAAAEAGFDVGESWGFFTDKPDYYPEFQNLSAKMVFDRRTRKILGVQAASKGEAIRRIDAASSMIRMGFTLEQVKDFEHAYAPPYADVIDPLHYLSYIGISSLEEEAIAISPLEFQEIAGDHIIIDLREPFEVKEKPIDVPYLGLKNIPFTQLRQSYDQIPKGEPILVVCPRGSRSSEAARILKQNGFDKVRYVGGGIAFFNA